MGSQGRIMAMRDAIGLSDNTGYILCELSEAVFNFQNLIIDYGNVRKHTWEI